MSFDRRIDQRPRPFRLAIASDLKFDALLFLKPSVVDAQELPIRRQLHQVDIRAIVDVRFHVRRKLSEILMFFECFPQMLTGHAVDDASLVDMASKIEVASLRSCRDSPPLRRDLQLLLTGRVGCGR